MRVLEKELAAIKEFFSEFDVGQLLLFGSRLDDSKRGGDIDLLWIVPVNFCESFRHQKAKIIFDLQGRIGEQRVDLTIVTSDEIKKDLFLQSVIDSSPVVVWEKK